MAWLYKWTENFALWLLDGEMIDKKSGRWEY